MSALDDLLEDFSAPEKPLPPIAWSWNAARTRLSNIQRGTLVRYILAQTEDCVGSHAAWERIGQLIEAAKQNGEAAGVVEALTNRRGHAASAYNLNLERLKCLEAERDRRAADDLISGRVTYRSSVCTGKGAQ